MIRMLVAAVFLALPTAAFAQEALYKSYMDAAGKALQAGEWKEVEKMAKLADKEASGFKADDIRRNFPNNMLANAYRSQSRYSDAIELYKRGLEKAESVGANHPGITFQCDALGDIYLSLGRPDLAEPLMRQSLKVHESQAKPENWKLAMGMRNIARCMSESGKMDEAEVLYKQAIKLIETEPARQLHVAHALLALARIYLVTDRASEADALSKQALDKYLELKINGPPTGRAHFVQAHVKAAIGKPTEALELYKTGFKLWATDASQTDSPELIPVLTAYAKLLRADKKIAEATKLETRAADLQSKLDAGRKAISK